MIISKNIDISAACVDAADHIQISLTRTAAKKPLDMPEEEMGKRSLSPKDMPENRDEEKDHYHQI